MTRQEKIRKGIKKHIETYEELDPDVLGGMIMDYLHSQGCVLKVDKELPNTYLGWRKLEKRTSKMPDYGGGMFEDNLASVQDEHTKKVMLKAGYVAVVPLIEEEK